MQFTNLPTTGKVGRSLNPPMTEAAINSLLRRCAEVAPPIVRGKRRWRPEDVAALVDLIHARAQNEHLIK